MDRRKFTQLPYFYKGARFILKYLENISKIHFIGIGGVSMNALALCLADMGYEVSGSDKKESAVTKMLENSGIKIYITQSKDNIKSPDLVVYTAAVHPDNEELQEAKRKGITCIERAILLGEMLTKYKMPIGVSGTHGKTTVTSMISTIALEASIDPTIMVGGFLPEINGNLRIGKGEHIIFESCEYSNSFLNFNPFISVILNIEADHLDFFKDLDDIISSFKKYANNTLNGGVIVANAEDENLTKALDGYKGRVITFGIEKGDYKAVSINHKDGKTNIEIMHSGKIIADISLNIVGIHNVKNALAAFVCCREMGIEIPKIKAALERFSGAKRRFELRKTINNIAIYDDYAHHPTEIKASLLAAREIAKGKVIVAFQPHTYSRTKALAPDFAKSLEIADVVILAPIFAAREVNTFGVSSKDISDKIENAMYLESFDEIVDTIQKIAKDGDIVISMGAGNICEICNLLEF